MDSDQKIASTPVQSSVTPELPKQPEKLLSAPHRASVGALIGIIIILAVLIIGALYFWGAKLTKEDVLKSRGTSGVEADIEIRN